MKTKQYNNPVEAYKLVNRWTKMKTCYEIQFKTKEITKVEIMFDGKQPKCLTVYYKTATHPICFENIYLSTKDLLDQPDKVRPLMGIDKFFEEKCHETQEKTKLLKNQSNEEFPFSGIDEFFKRK